MERGIIKRVIAGVIDEEDLTEQYPRDIFDNPAEETTLNSRTFVQDLDVEYTAYILAVSQSDDVTGFLYRVTRGTDYIMV
jgi:hypothetical protein